MNKLNLSGHHSAQLEQEGFLCPGSIHLDPPLLGEKGPKVVAEKVTQWLEENVSLDEDCQVEVALPGLPILRDIVMAWLHSKTGVFPVTRIPHRQADGSFVFVEGLDLQSFRNQVRQNRKKSALID